MVALEQEIRKKNEAQSCEKQPREEERDAHLFVLLTEHPVLADVFALQQVDTSSDRTYFFIDDVRDILQIRHSQFNRAWTDWCMYGGGVVPFPIQTPEGRRNIIDADLLIDFFWFNHEQAKGHAKLKFRTPGNSSALSPPVEQQIPVVDQEVLVVKEVVNGGVIEEEIAEDKRLETDSNPASVVYSRQEPTESTEPKIPERRRRKKSVKEMPDDPMGGYEVDSDDEETSNYEDEFNPDESEEPLDDEEAYREEDGAEFQLVNSEQMDEDLLAQINPDDPVGMYFRQMAQEPLLEAAKEVELAKRIELGKVASERLNTFPSDEDTSQPELQQLIDDGQAAREHLARANTRLVVSVAKRYIGQGLPFSDVIQEGNLGLMRAVDKYDYTRGNRFSTYATWWIRQAITRALAQKTRTIRIPLHMTERIRQMYRKSQVMEQNLGRRPYPEELAAELGEPVDTIHGMLEVSQHAISLQRPVGDDENAEYGDFIEDQDSPSPVELATRHALRETLEEVLSELQPRNRYIIKLRFGLIDGEQHTLEDIAAEFGLSRERIRQLEKETLRRLRHPTISKRLRDYAT